MLAAHDLGLLLATGDSNRYEAQLSVSSIGYMVPCQSAEYIREKEIARATVILVSLG